MTKQQDREEFNREGAPALLLQTELAGIRRSPSSPKRFAYFEDDDRFVIVAGPQEDHEVDLAIVYGMTFRGEKRLVLVLPTAHSFPTLQRAAWFKRDAKPEVWVHDSGGVKKIELGTHKQTLDALKKKLGDQAPSVELATASTPLHLGDATDAVRQLAEWATNHSDLDSGHRQGERSWHHEGQRVLSIKRSKSGVEIRAGIHSTKDTGIEGKFHIPTGKSMEAHVLLSIQEQVRNGMRQRSETGAKYNGADEHWLQAAIRRDPRLVGVEQPALREVPAWRPRSNGVDPEDSWGRGFIDLLGVDGHGNVRIVETKIASNQDDLLILQGLDYFVWCRLYKNALLQRLGAHRKARFELHYVVGAKEDGTASISRFSAALGAALDEKIRWHLQVVRDWFPWEGVAKPSSELYPPRTLPDAG